MRIRSRINRLEKRFGRFKKDPPIIFVHEYSGETVESKYQEYLDRGGNPNIAIHEIKWFIYKHQDDHEPSLKGTNQDRTG